MTAHFCIPKQRRFRTKAAAARLDDKSGKLVPRQLPQGRFLDEAIRFRQINFKFFCSFLRQNTMIAPTQEAAAHIKATVKNFRAPPRFGANDGIDAKQASRPSPLVESTRGALRSPWSGPPPVATEKVDCVFLWRDTGDAKNLLPVAERLVQTGLAVRVIVLGNAAKTVANNAPALRGRVLWPDTIKGVVSQLGDTADELGGSAGQHVRFKEAEDAARIAACFDTPVVVTGCVSRAQRNLCTAFKAKAMPPRVMGYVDSLAINPSSMFYRRSAKTSHYERAYCNTSIARIKKDPYSVSSFGAILDTVWVPLAASAPNIATKAGIPKVQIEAMGHPGTEDILTQLAERQACGQRAEVRRKLMGEANELPLLFYAGGRRTDASNTYKRSFHTFVAGVIKEASRPQTRRIKVVVGLHPASDGADERDVIREFGAEHIVELNTNHALKTDDLLLAADIVVSWNSTVASQAALLSGTLHKQVCFVDVADDPDLPFVVPAGLAIQVRTSKAVTDFLASALESPTFPKNALPLPFGAAGRIADAVTETARKAG